ncbi:hypothetical protein DS901_13620 [Loktanella sp. D2R18]|nr:hypothetical protein DS901_13620 [Loktanella sp. D2R18]
MIMQVVIRLISDYMLPKSALPDTFFTGAQFGLWPFGGDRAMARKCRLYQPPAFGIVGVVGRQRPDHMQLVWQDDRRIDLERPALHAKTGYTSQKIDPIDQKRRTRVTQMDRKEIGATGHIESAIL